MGLLRNPATTPFLAWFTVGTIPPSLRNNIRCGVGPPLRKPSTVCAAPERLPRSMRATTDGQLPSDACGPCHHTGRTARNTDGGCKGMLWGYVPTRYRGKRSRIAEGLAECTTPLEWVTASSRGLRKRLTSARRRCDGVRVKETALVAQRLVLLAHNQWTVVRLHTGAPSAYSSMERATAP